jgi:hypothetical protein
MKIVNILQSFFKPKETKSKKPGEKGKAGLGVGNKVDKEVKEEVQKESK